MHLRRSRARYLAEEVFTSKDDRILFTTFTKNLPTDISLLSYRLITAAQFTTTISGGGPCCALPAAMRNFWPSRETS
jgi:hypothetical protein